MKLLYSHEGCIERKKCTQGREYGLPQNQTDRRWSEGVGDAIIANTKEVIVHFINRGGVSDI